VITKKFNQELHDACDPLTREAVSKWLTMKWGVVAEANPDKYAVDLVIKRDGKLVAYAEVEVRNWLQESTHCPYDTIHVAERKQKLLNNQLPTLFFVVTRDFKNAYWTKAEEILKSPMLEVKNTAVAEGERFYDVPKSVWKYVDLMELF
jgi:hypothetical protein